jgi:MFS family permease
MPSERRRSAGVEPPFRRAAFILTDRQWAVLEPLEALRAAASIGALPAPMQRRDRMTGATEGIMRWFVVVGAAVILALVMGMLVNGLTAFFIPMEIAEGWKRADIAAINSVGLLGLAFGSAVMGFVAEGIGLRAICVTASAVMSACLMVASQVTAPWQASVVFFVAGVFAGGAIFAPLFAAVGNWFPGMAGVAIGIAAAGQAVGQGGVPFLSVYLIDAFGWRGALLALGAATFVILTPLASWMREAPAQHATTGAATAPPLPPRLAVPILSAAVFACCACMAVPLMHLMPLIQGFCIPATDAGSVMFAMLVAAVAGRIAYGRLCDLIGPVQSWAVASFLQLVGVAAFTQFETLRGFMAFGVIYGFAYAGVMTSVLVSARALMPAPRRASLMGIILSFAWLGHAFGGFQGAVAFDLTGSYVPGFVAGSIAGLVNLLLVALLLILGKPRQPLRNASA